jgi:hypothetical protein
VHLTVIRAWKKEFLASSVEILEKAAPDKAIEKQQSEPYQQIGQINVDNNWLKAGILGRHFKEQLIELKSKELSVRC